MTRRVGVLGSTGSVGSQTLDVIRSFPDKFDVVALSTHTSTEMLGEQIEEFQPEGIGVSDPKTATQEEWLEGSNSLRKLARMDLDLLVVAVTGMAGLLPTLEALKQDTSVALASKEAIVVGGTLIKETEQASRGQVLPLDSEHHAVYELLRGETLESIQTVYLTASGGPFRNRSRNDLKGISPEQALDHPNWDMGPKITVDSATMMNKGLELIEAKHLFKLEADQLQAVIHPQSRVHALVEFVDASLKAQMSEPDMRHPIQSVLMEGSRKSGPVDRLDLTESLTLDFESVDPERFPTYNLAREAMKLGGTAPTILNAANSEAVRSFLNGRLSFLEIPDVIERCLSEGSVDYEVTLDRILDVDERTRERARRVIQKSS